MTVKKLFPFLVTCCMFVLFYSCNKEPVKPKENIEVSQMPPINLRESTASLFGADHIVPIHVARALAENINFVVSEAMKVGTLNTVRAVDSLFTISDSLGTPLLYIANYTDSGYIVISADDRHEPICALTEQGKYQVAEVPSMLLEWFEITLENIVALKRGDIPITNYADGEWVRLIKNIGKAEYLTLDDCCPECPNYPTCLTHPTIGCGDSDILCEGGNNEDPCWPYTTFTKGPLMTTKWNQGCTFNDLCPDKDCDNVCGNNENAWTGCVATAIAQILKYWAHPCSQGYDYAPMPNSYGDSEVQRMMRDIGIAVDMDYGCDGSGAYAHKAEDAFKDDFCYATATYNGYGPGSYQTVIQNIDANQPVLLDGCRTRKKWFGGLFYTYSNCHMWVCDGYERNQNSCYTTLRFHMNWGWGPYGGNGWFFYNTWAPGSSSYQYAQNFTYNIHP